MTKQTTGRTVLMVLIPPQGLFGMGQIIELKNKGLEHIQINKNCRIVKKN